MQKCKSVRKCKSVNYMRKSGVCELNDADRTTKPEALQARAGSIYSAKCDWDFEEPEHCSSCSDTHFCSTTKDNHCEIFGCPAPVPVPGAKILGNLFNVGTKRLYRCSDGAQQVSICQEDGTWTRVTLKCTCEKLEIENANYTIIETDSGVTEATISCASGYVPSSIKTIQCNKDEWKWENLEQFYCVSIYAPPWILVYRTIQGTKGARGIHSWWGDNGERADGEFRNDEIVDNWNDMNISRVKVDILNNFGDVAATLLFNGTGTDKWNWFSNETLIKSSWIDLRADTPVSVFSITGVRWQQSKRTDRPLRWAILQNKEKADGSFTVDCSETIVWFAVMRTRFSPCDDENIPGGKDIKIVFSGNKNGTTWEDGNLHEASEFMVSVLRK